MDTRTELFKTYEVKDVQYKKSISIVIDKSDLRSGYTIVELSLRAFSDLLLIFDYFLIICYILQEFRLLLLNIRFINKLLTLVIPNF